jgi:hypothetical protein
MASLSKGTRKNIKRYLNKIRTDLPALKHSILIGDEIKDWHVQSIIELNKARMQRKQKVSAYDESETARVIQLAKLCGLVRIMEIDGNMVAGEICSRAGSHYFSHVGAHDPAYDEYRLGILNCYLTICECIDRRGKQFHFLWGQYDYKYSLLGVQHDLNHVALYRSYAYLLLNGAKAFRLKCEAVSRAIKNFIYIQKRKETDDSSLASKSIWAILRLKDFISSSHSKANDEKKTLFVSSRPAKLIYIDSKIAEQKPVNGKVQANGEFEKSNLAKECV